MIGVQAKADAASFAAGKRSVATAVSKAAYETFRHAAMSIRKDAVASIKHKKNKDAESPEGEPPHQHKPGFLKRAVWAHYEETGAIIGFQASKVDQVAAIHEHGLIEEGRDYPERPTMQPALERNIERFHRDWRASVG